MTSSAPHIPIYAIDTLPALSDRVLPQLHEEPATWRPLGPRLSSRPDAAELTELKAAHFDSIKTETISIRRRARISGWRWSEQLLA